MSSRRKRMASALVGVVLGAALMGGIAYTRRGNVPFSAAAGALLVGMLWYGVAVGTVSRVTLGAVLFGLFGFMIGPGYDDYEGIGALPLAIVGAFVGWRFRQRGRKVGLSKNPRGGRDFSSSNF